MATTNAQNKSGDDAGLTDLRDQFDTLKSEMKAMTEMLGTTATTRAEGVKDDAIARMELIGSEARHRVDSIQDEAERAVLSNPVMALAVSAGVGFIIGALTRR